MTPEIFMEKLQSLCEEGKILCSEWKFVGCLVNSATDEIHTCGLHSGTYFEAGGVLNAMQLVMARQYFGVAKERTS